MSLASSIARQGRSWTAAAVRFQPVAALRARCGADLLRRLRVGAAGDEPALYFDLYLTLPGRYKRYGLDIDRRLTRSLDQEVPDLMHDLDIARLIHADRERDIERGLRASALRRALEDRDGDTFVPRLSESPVRIAHPLRLLELRRLG